MSTKIFITFTCKMRSLPTLFRYVEKTTVKTGKTNLRKNGKSIFRNIPRINFQFHLISFFNFKSSRFWCFVEINPFQILITIPITIYQLQKKYCKLKAPILTVRTGVELKIISTKKIDVSCHSVRVIRVYPVNVFATQLMDGKRMSMLYSRNILEWEIWKFLRSVEDNWQKFDVDRE